MVDVSNLTPAQQQQHDVMLLQHYHELCNMNDVRIHMIRMTEGRLESVYVPDVRIHHLQFTSTYQPAQMYR